MDQENIIFENSEENSWEQPEPQMEPYRMSFADPVYEMPFGEVYQKPAKPKKKRKKKEDQKQGKRVLCAILALVLVLVSCLATGLVMNGMWQRRFDDMQRSMDKKMGALQNQMTGMSGGVMPSGGTAGGSGTMTPGQVYAQAASTVVAVAAHVQQRDFFGQSLSGVSYGSGFIISPDGYAVTNYHVIQGASRIELTTIDDEVYEAKLVGHNEDNDFALLKVEAQDLPYAVLGSSATLAVGDLVAAIGNPLGNLTSTMTVGYVSAKDRIVTAAGSSINMIQTDAAINSGNSGGPLFNMQGEVVGITSAKYSGNSASGVSIEGIGFAIPIDDVIGMIDDLQQQGYISGAYLGVMVLDVTEDAGIYGVPMGAYVDEVIPGYAAEAASIYRGDIITEVGGYEVDSVASLTRTLRKFKPGQEVNVTVFRGNAEKEIKVVLSEKPREDVETQTETEKEYLMPGDEGFEEWYQGFVEDHFG